ncbi:histidine phosphatase family protein [Nocardioides aestuarii]|uniref:SixA phosphatase family protein n=1 Tax=Nocardioides aestuarii TaxID=252231 RepID=A0ABW4TTB0_9ACTN
MQQSRRLVVVRHAAAEQGAATDAERTLTDGGRDDARTAGEWLAAEGLVVDHALVSAALRAQETWASLAAGAAADLEPDVSRLLYSAEPETVLDLLREVPTESSCVVVVGHNPTMAYLANLLDDGEGDEAAATELTTRGFPTCSLAVFAYDGEWADLDVTSATLRAFHVGRA